MDCTLCSKGMYCPDKKRPLQIDCDVGMYSDGPGKDECIKCPVNHECIDKNIATPCTEHYYSLEGWGVCRPCPAGMRCVDGSNGRILEPEKCAAGYYSIEGDKVCHICPEGTYCPAKSSSPTPCAPGTYQDQKGQESCKSCGTGEYSLSGAITACVKCPEGSYCPTKNSIPIPCGLGTYSGERQIKCSQCSAGYVCSFESKNSTSDECPKGYYCIYVNEKLKIEPCPVGKYGIMEGADTETNGCKECPAGYFCPFNGMTVPILCLAGGYCLENSPLPILCPDGEYNLNKGSEFATDCKSCPAGNYCPEGTIEPLPCKPGHYCGAGSGVTGSKKPEPCPAGTYTSDPAASIIGDCIPCPAGYYCKEGAISPEPCPAGTYNTCLLYTSPSPRD
eukprot:TRINITY_DN426_c0_g1_i4.p1 TRINITY_DN426_c0_g1~~TRINITY_DN426_c0_g1_i4.p1  ORF type:complete len:391 (+),score=0.86 TRINITY_DN426_c0_g1_i4:1433-2605(+)